MKKSNIKIISPLLCCIPMTGFAETDYLPVPYEEWEVLDDTYADKQDVHFFVGLASPLISYTNVKVSDKVSHLTEKQTETKINYNLFDKMGINFGIQSESGFRLTFAIQHYNTEIKFIDGSDAKSSYSEFGASVAIPLITKVATQPFLTLGLSFVMQDNVNNTGIDMDNPVFAFGLGIAHNFSDHVFGTLTGNYQFMPRQDISDLDVSYSGNALHIGVGLGYKF